MTTKEFETLYNQYWRVVFNAANKVLRDKETAKNITQDVFVALWSTDISGVKKMRNYLATAAWFGALQHIKKVHRENLSLLRTRRNDNKVFQDHSDLKVLDEILDKMPTPHRKVFILGRLTSHTNLEISKLMDLSVRTVKNYLVLADDFVKYNLTISRMPLKHF